MTMTKILLAWTFDVLYSNSVNVSDSACVIESRHIT
jgi:hypothetical protein